MGSIDYSIVIPVFNSADSLPNLHAELTQVMNDLGRSYELIYVDDLSHDNSWSVLKSLQEQSGDTRILRLGKNVGQLMATHCGVSRCCGCNIITIDDDLEYLTRDINKLILFYEEHDFLLVYGIARYKKGRGLLSRQLYNTRNLLLNMVLGKFETDSFRVFSRRIVLDDSGACLSKLHFEAHLKHSIAQRMVGYVEVEHRVRPFGKSGHNAFKKAGIIVRHGVEYMWEPLTPIVVVGAILMGVSPFTVPVLLGLQAENWSLSVFFGTGIGLSLILLGIIVNYTVKIFLMLKGVPEYLVIEER